MEFVDRGKKQGIIYDWFQEPIVLSLIVIEFKAGMNTSRLVIVTQDLTILGQLLQKL